MFLFFHEFAEAVERGCLGVGVFEEFGNDFEEVILLFGVFEISLVVEGGFAFCDAKIVWIGEGFKGLQGNSSGELSAHRGEGACGCSHQKYLFSF